MKLKLFALALPLFLASCTFNTEVSQDVSVASERTISNILKGNYEAIYDDASVEMKSYVSEEAFLSVMNLQGNIYGKMVDAKLTNEASGKYKSTATTIYQYELENEQGDSFNLTLEFLKGHLLKNFVEEPDWRNESDFVKSLVNPVKSLVFNQDSKKVYELLDEKYPEEQVQALIDRIAENCNGVTNRYEYHWTDNDKSGKMMVAFVYAYEGKGALEYRFYIEDEDYPFAGIFFTPDNNTKLP